MVRDLIIDYIRSEFQAGKSRGEIKNALLRADWPERDVEDTLNVVLEPQAVPPPPPNAPPPLYQPATYPSGARETAARLPGVFELLGKAWQIYKARFWTFLGVFVLPVLTIAILVIFGALGSLLTSFITGGIGAGLIVILVISFLTILIIQFWGQAALLYAIKDSEERIGVIESYKRGWRRILPLFWLGLLSGLIISGGFLLFIIPGVIFFVWFSLALFILIAEDLRGTNALLKSREYVRERWGSVLWRLIAPILLALVIILPTLFIPFVSSLLAAFFLTPLLLIYTFLLYQYLKSLKGEFIFAPTTKQKTIYLGIGLLGILVVLITPIILLSSNRVPFSNVDLSSESRDVQRTFDLDTLESSIKLYLSDVPNPSLCAGKNILYASNRIEPPIGWKLGGGIGKTEVNGIGWVPINLNEISGGGSPIEKLPLDPLNDPDKDLVYLYACDPENQTFELDAKFEGQKYNKGGENDRTSTDFGSDPDIFEVGTDLNLIP